MKQHRVGFSILRGSFEEIQALAEELAREIPKNAVVACKASRYEKLRELFSHAAHAPLLLPIEGAQDYAFFLSQIDVLHIEDAGELQHVATQGLLTLQQR